MPELPADEPAAGGSDEQTLEEIIADLTWEQILADGVITTEEIDASLRAEGLDPRALDHLYD